MAAERLQAEDGGGGHAVTRRSHGDVQGSVRLAALFLIPIKKEFYRILYGIGTRRVNLKNFLSIIFD
jgi:hypothetical protein